MAKGEWKIFEIKSSESEWICARTNIEALQCLSSTTGVHLFDLCDTDEILEVPKEQWEEHYVIMVDGTEEEQDDSKISFTQWMEQHDGKHPEMIASTVY